MPVLFSLTLLTSAFLLFCIEPMVAKMLLPLLGGVPSVWNTCLVFFQGALLLGYVFALGTLRALGPKKQAVLQIVVVGGSLLAMPIWIDGHTADRFAGLGPVGQVIAVLTVAAGLPFFALSTIAPTLQRWYSTTNAPRAADPYFLYAASNVGSLGALALYPLAFEPRFGLDEQTTLLRLGYVGLAALVLACAIATLRLSNEKKTEESRPAQTPTRQRLRWVFLSAVPSAYLVAVTTHITTDVTPTPFLWVAPLAVYLLSFVLVFAAKPLLPHARVNRLLPLVATATVYAIATGATDPIWAVIPLHVLGFFGACMLCHGELARDRPEPARLNEFYVWMSVGGFVGGVTVALVVPLLTTRAIEYPACVVLALAARPILQKPAAEPEADAKVAKKEPEKKEPEAVARRRDWLIPVLALVGTIALALLAHRAPFGLQKTITMLPIVPLLLVYRHLDRPRRFAAAIGAICLGASLFPSPFGEILERHRNFFGSLTVTKNPDGKWIQINHGTTIHGLQSIDPAGKREPRSYYTRKGPVGDVFRVYGEDASLPRNVAVIGLGAGTIAAYAKPGEDWTFFEINPAVVGIAQNPKFFTYLSDAFPNGQGLRIAIGDARLEIARQQGNYGTLLIDAFSSDAIPVHLVTEQAMALYVTKMAPGAIMAWHISNRSIDLRPVLAALAASQGWTGRIRQDFDISVADHDEGRAASVWVAMSTNVATLDRLGAGWEPLATRPGFRSWTDQRSSVVAALHF